MDNCLQDLCAALTHRKEKPGARREKWVVVTIASVANLWITACVNCVKVSSFCTMPLCQQ